MFKKSVVLFIFATIISACTNGIDVQPVDNRTKAEKQRDESGSFLGLGNSVGGKKTEIEGELIKVNAYLWRSALDTLSINPLEKIMPNVGTVQTEWVALSPSEQTKISVIVLSAKLQTSGIRVNVYKRVRKNGSWINQQVDSSISRKIENAILSRARELRIADNKK